MMRRGGGIQHGSPHNAGSSVGAEWGYQKVNHVSDVERKTVGPAGGLVALSLHSIDGLAGSRV